jgi:hypothetical protein
MKITVFLYVTQCSLVDNNFLKESILKKETAHSSDVSNTCQIIKPPIPEDSYIQIYLTFTQKLQ